MQSKTQLRKEIIQKRKSMSIDDAMYKSELICKEIIETSIYKNSKTVLLYMSINNEVMLDYLIDDCLKNDKIIAFPRVSGNSMDFFAVKNMAEFQNGSFNIMEPVSNQVIEKADLMIVPGVAFTKSGYRLGYGGGFYDKYLSKASLHTIGVGYDFQICNALPVEKHDKILNDIIYA